MIAIVLCLVDEAGVVQFVSLKDPVARTLSSEIFTQGTIPTSKRRKAGES